MSITEPVDPNEDSPEEEQEPETETPGSVAEHLGTTLSHDEGEGSQRTS